MDILSMKKLWKDALREKQMLTRGKSKVTVGIIASAAL